MRGPDPSYAQGFARYRDESERPDLWKGLVGLWAPYLGPTGNKLLDWSGYWNHGTLTNMDPATDWVVAKDGYKLEYLKSLAQRVSVATSPSIEPGLGNFSVVWVASPVDAGSGSNYFDKRNVGSPYTGFQVGQGANRSTLACELNGSTRRTFQIATSRFISNTSGERFNLAVTFDRKGLAIVYRDGVSIGTEDINVAVSEVVAGVNPLKIGGHHTNNTGYSFSGIYGYLYLFLRILNPSEIMDLYIDPKAILRKRIPVFYSVPAAPDGAIIPIGAIARWHMNQRINNS